MLLRLVDPPVHDEALPCGEGAEPTLVATWDELSAVLKKAKKGQYGCWELYGDGTSPPQKVRVLLAGDLPCGLRL